MVDMQTESELDLDCDLVLDDVSCLGLLSCKDEFAVATPSATSDLMIARDLTEAVIAAQLSDNFWRCPSDPAGDFTSGNSTPETVTSTAKAAVTAPVTSTVPRRPTPKRRRARVAPRRSSAAPSEESHETQPAVSPVMPSPWLWMHPHPASLGMGASLAVSHLHQQHCFQQTLAYAHSLCGQCPAPLYNQGSQFFGYAPLHCPSNYISQARRALPHDSANVSKEEKDHADAVLVMAVTSKQHQHSSDASCVTQSDSYHQQDQQVISSRCKPGAPERSNLQLDRQIASQRKSKRRQQDKDLLHQLDDMLPMAARSKQRKSAGWVQCLFAGAYWGCRLHARVQNGSRLTACSRLHRRQVSRSRHFWTFSAHSVGRCSQVACEMTCISSLHEPRRAPWRAHRTCSLAAMRPCRCTT